MRSHRDGRWPLAPPSHDGLARAVAARPPLVRRRRRAAASHVASSRGRLSRRVVARPPTLAPTSRNGLSRRRRTTASRAPSLRDRLSRRCRTTTSRAVVARRRLRRRRRQRRLRRVPRHTPLGVSRELRDGNAGRDAGGARRTSPGGAPGAPEPTRAQVRWQRGRRAPASVCFLRLIALDYV